jgi:hypothetical protein
MTSAVHRPERTSRRINWRLGHLVGLTALTAYSTALGWQAQLVSYPLYRAVGTADFAAYHQQYNESIPLVVIAPGFASFLAGAAFLWTRPDDVPRRVAAVVSGAGLAALLSTVAWAIPMHDRLDAIGQEAATIESLLQANLWRTLALTVSTAVLGWCAVTSGRPAERAAL